MQISKLRKEFTVYNVDNDAQSGRALTDLLKTFGYENAVLFATVDEAMTAVRNDPPHVLLFDYENYHSVAETVLADIAVASPETLTILLASSQQALTALQIVGRGLAYDYVVRPVLMAMEVVQKVDRAAGRLYFQFETEQIKEFYEKRLAASPGGTGPAPSPNDLPPPPLPAATVDYSAVSMTLEKFIATKDIDDSVRLFMENISQIAGGVPVIYFRYLASHMSLIFANAVGLPSDQFRGIGIDLKSLDAAQAMALLDKPAESPLIRNLVQEVFRAEKFRVFSNTAESDAAGVFVVLGDVEVDDPRAPGTSYRRIFELTHKRNIVLKEKHALDIYDPVTGLFNRRHFAKLVDDEIARARRTYMPVSLLILDLDGTAKLNEKMGFRQTDAVMKTLAVILKKTARTNDLLARVGPDEFACLMPHTAHAGAAIKAERLRRLVESTRIPLLESFGIGNITFSAGVTEYPSLCGDAESLVRSAEEALDEVRRSGGNKVCLFTPTAGFKKDFEPLVVQDPRRGSGKEPA